jgi:hypothetical protein
MTVVGRAQYNRLATIDRAALSGALQEALHGATTFKPRWGRVGLSSAKNSVVFDLYDVPEAACVDLLMFANDQPEVLRVAVSAQAADEQGLPISPKAADAMCRRHRPMVRYILIAK